MLVKHLNICVCLHFIVFFRCNNCGLVLESTEANLNLLKNVVQLTDNFLEVTPILNITLSSLPTNCVQMACKFVCFNGHADEIARDIDIVRAKNSHKCKRIEELRLYNYEFPENQLSFGFLGPYSDKVENLYLACSNITDVAAGSFADGIFKEIFFENLKLISLRKDFFQGISQDFQSLSVVQKENSLAWVDVNFLDFVKYQIKYLAMQVGLTCVRNLTGSDNLLNNVVFADFSHNNFGGELTTTVFCKLSMVEHLDLSHSKIETLPAYIFSDLVATLEYLNLSHNKLKTLSQNIFGWHEVPRDLKLYVDNNRWVCSCDFQKQIKEIVLYQSTRLECYEPEIYKNWSVFDEEICENEYEEASGIQNVTNVTLSTAGTTNSEGIHNKTEKYFTTWAKPEVTPRPLGFKPSKPSKIASSTAPNWDYKPTNIMNPELVTFDCHNGLPSEQPVEHELNWPQVTFSISSRDKLRVAIVVEPTSLISTLNDSFGLIWFSRVTTEYYKMEINYNEYGLGCYKSILPVSTVNDLIPNAAYTFCMVLEDQMTVSPFNCKSIYVKSNLDVQFSNAWLTSDKKTAGCSLVVIGIVIFAFAGIVLIYMLLKHKPKLLKGSKRVTTHRGSRHQEDIVVLPRAKSVKSIKEKEDKLAKRCSQFPSDRQRRNSSESVASYESYINTNLYEVIPAYLKFESTLDQTPSTSRSISTSTSTASILSQEQQKLSTLDVEKNLNYKTPLYSVLNPADLIEYAEIPYRTKRVSNDPLPEIPRDQEPYNGKTVERKLFPDMGIIYMLDSQV